MKLLSSSLSLLLTVLITVTPIGAQLPPAVSGLQLRLLESDPAAPVGSRSTKGFTVEVTDAAGAVADAAVAFRLPENGPTGAFADGSHAAVAYTDAAGRAHISGILWGTTAGAAELRITAAKGAAHAGLLLEHTLTSRTAMAQPGVLKPSVVTAAEPAILVTARSGASAPIAPAASPKDEVPSVTVTNASPGQQPHSKKWLIVLLVAAGGAAGAAFAFKGKGTPSAPSTPSLSIGSPTISIGH
jgi:hypothetical protein